MSEQLRPTRARFFTICASNYLANAVVLGQSISAAHDGSRLTVFLLDEMPADVTVPGHIDIVPAATIMPIADWHHYQCFYAPLELATSIKPLCFRYLLTPDCVAAVYLDPEIVLFKPLDRVLSAVEDGHDVALTPHILTPLPNDGK